MSLRVRTVPNELELGTSRGTGQRNPLLKLGIWTMTQHPKYSAVNPALRLRWSPSALKDLMECPRLHQYREQGWRPPEKKADFVYGGLVDGGLEVFTLARFHGASRDDAQLAAVQHVLEESWWYEGVCAKGTYIDREQERATGPGGEFCGAEFRILGMSAQGKGCPKCHNHNIEWGASYPWSGVYRHGWRCAHNPGRGKKKCEWAKKTTWGDAPQVCGECGSDILTFTEWVPDHSTKNRYNAVRAVCWYAEDQPEKYEDGVTLLTMANGEPAVQQDIEVTLPFKAYTGEQFTLHGRLDAGVRFGSEAFLGETKTTKQALGRRYFTSFSPDTQIDTYDLIGWLASLQGDGLFGKAVKRLAGVMLEAHQCLVSGTRWGRHRLYRSKSQREEWLSDIGHWLNQACKFAQADRWPMNKANCWHCDFNSICSKPKEERERYLRADFEQRKEEK